MRWVTEKNNFLYEEGKIFQILPREKRNKKLKILIILDTDIVIPPSTGVTYRLYHLSTALVAIGNEVVWIIANRRSEKWDDFSDLEGIGIKIHLVDTESFYDQSSLDKIVSDEAPDIIQFESAQAMMRFGLELRKKNNIPLLLELHDVDAALRSASLQHDKMELADFIQRVACYECDSLVTMTPTDYNYFSSKLAVPKEKIFLAPNGVYSENIEYFENKKQILFLGNLFYKPNQDAFVEFADELMEEIHKAFPDIKLVSIGRTPDFLIEKYENKEYIILSGEVKDSDLFKEIIQKSFVGLCTVRTGSGMKVKNLTYGSFGLPIISTKLGASGYESVKSLLMGESKKEWLDHIVILLTNPPKGVELGLQTKSFIDSGYAWENIAKTVLLAIEQALDFFAARKECPLDEIWLEEGRSAASVEQGHVVVNNKKII